MARLEHEEKEAREVANQAEEYVSEFDSLEDLRGSMDSQNDPDEEIYLENIYNGAAMNCSVRTAAQAIYNDVKGNSQGALHISYNTFGPFPVDNHITYEDEDDVVPHDWQEGFDNTEEFSVSDLSGLRAVNVLTRGAPEGSIADQEFKALRERRDSEFLDGFNKAMKLDRLGGNLPGPLSSFYEKTTSLI